MITLKPTAPELFFSKSDPNDIRLGDLVKSASIESISPLQGFGICGYADHEGIAMNGGRTGAAAAPPQIRQFLYKMTPPTSRPPTQPLYDVGDIGADGSLAERHLAAEEVIYKLQTGGLRTLSLGGGHDYGYPDTSAFLRAQVQLSPQSRPLVINFDAHLDVRPTTHGHHSGTPFYRLLEAYRDRFHFIEIGLQPQCNSPFHRIWAQQNGAHLFDLQDIHRNGGLSRILNHPVFTAIPARTPVFISFDIDSLCSAEAPGCSQSWTTGLKLQDYLDFFALLKQQHDIRGLGIYEVSPPLDIGHLTSKAAALIAYHYLFAGDL